MTGRGFDAIMAAMFLVSFPLTAHIAPVLFAPAMLLALTASALAQSNGSPLPPPDEGGIWRNSLHYSIYGAGEPMLAIHGLGGDMYSWREFVSPQIAFPNHQIILLDLKGAGDSPKPRDNDYSVITQADLIYRFIQDRNLTNLTIVGNSYGGVVSLLLAIRLCQDHSGRLVRLILIDSGGYDRELPTHLKILRTPLIGWLVVHLLPPRCQTRKVLHDSYYDPRKITDEQVNEYARPIAMRNGRYALLKTAQQAIPKDFQRYIDQYCKINVPTLILWGAHDDILPVDIAQSLQHDIDNGSSPLEFIDRAGHVPQEEMPTETIRRMKAFMGIP